MGAKRLCLSAVTIVAAVLLVTSGNATARDGAVEAGAAWLAANQDVSGFWGMEKEAPFRDAAAAVLALSTARAESMAAARGLEALRSAPVTSCDYLARKLMANASAAPGDVSSELTERLVSAQNGDGGWGYREGYGSDNLDTALVLRALKSASCSNTAVLAAGVDYVTTQQNPDGGWAFAAPGSSRVFYTAHVTMALATLAGDFDVAAQLQSAADWLRTQPHGDGGFGSGTGSNPYETGLALGAVCRAEPSAPEVAAAANHLEASQLPDGSWSTDAYSTACAVYGLGHVAPDLAIGTNDVVLSNPAPSDSEVVVISSTIRNTGIHGATDVLVQVFDGHPLSGGTQIGQDALVSELPAGADSTLQVEWSTYGSYADSGIANPTAFGLAGDHDICVLVDPADEIAESDEFNNIAVKPIHVYYPPDLMIWSITFDPEFPDPLETVIIATTVKNVGEKTAHNVSLQVWDGDPDAGGIPLLSPPYNIPSIVPGGLFTLNLNMGSYFDEEGGHLITSCADVDDAIREVCETNNCGRDTLWVGYTCHDIALSAELNLLGLPLHPVSPITSTELIGQIPNCVELDGWDRSLQGWMSAVDAGGGSLIGDDFPVEPRDGFFARLTSAGVAPLCGGPVTEHESTSLDDGYNLVSVPNEDACYTAYTTIADIDSCTEAWSWDRDAQGWEIAERTGEDEFTGPDFPIVPGGGYFVRLTADTEWTTHTCDTLTMLPDLLVTPDDIALIPNPVPAGETVGIFVNIHNVGLETAYSPRLDIYNGDPDGGGTLLASGYLPVDIPAGGSSGYYGNYFEFPYQGYFDIYGIADFYDEIEELNEDNNQAYRTLQVTPSALAVAPGGDDEVAERRLRPSRLTRTERLVPLLFDVEVSSRTAHSTPPVVTGTRGERETTRPRVAAPGSLAAKPLDATAGSRGKARTTTISKVGTGNRTSASAAVVWVTDVPANGCVNYGTTTALGETECEAGPDGTVHMVVLDDLEAETAYYFEVVSGGTTDDNGGAYYNFSTTAAGAGLPYVVYGHVDLLGTGDLQGIAVKATLEHGDDVSHALVGLTDTAGVWVLNLGNAKSTATNNVVAFEVGDSLFFEVEGAENGTAVGAVSVCGVSPQDCGTLVIPATGVDEPIEPVPPTRYYLTAGHPNPFRESTTIGFGLPVGAHVALRVYDVVGRRVATLVDREYPPGHHAVTWSGRNATGQRVSSGVYFYRLESEEFDRSGKVFMLK
jgi:hypothetical protein